MISAALVVAVIATIAIILGLSTVRFAAAVYWQDQCMRYSAPADEAVLQVSPQGQTAHYSFVVPPRCWRALSASMGMPHGNCIAFCHSRVSPAGHRRLVVVPINQPSDILTLQDWIVMSRLPWPHPSARFNPPAIGRTSTGPAEIFAGQIDPTDASRFTIDYLWPDGVRGTLDGQLLDDDTVLITVRKGPGDLDSERLRVAQRQAFQASTQPQEK